MWYFIFGYSPPWLPLSYRVCVADECIPLVDERTSFKGILSSLASSVVLCPCGLVPPFDNEKNVRAGRNDSVRKSGRGGMTA